MPGIGNHIYFPAARTIWLAAVFALLAALLLGQAGYYAIVFADEQSYNKHSRLAELWTSPVPSYLYLFVYRLTNVCGDAFLGCARILNLFFLSLSVAVFYCLCRLWFSRNLSMAMSLIPLIYPTNSYAAYFMPEIPYALFFFTLVYLVLRLDKADGFLSATVAGCVLGLGTLIKAHALFLLPAFAAYIALRNMLHSRAGPAGTLGEMGLLVGSALAVKFALSYLLAGTAGLTFMGPFYSSVASSSTLTVDYLYGTALLALQSLSAHALVLALFFPLPVLLAVLSLSAMAAGLFRQSGESETGSPERNFSLILALTLGVSLAVVVAFSAKVAQSGGMESIGRLHMRYYNFITPLLLVLAAFEVVRPASTKSYLFGFGLFAVFAILALAGLEYLPSFAVTNFVDSPVFQAIRGAGWRLVALLFGGFFILALWCWNSRIGATVYMLVFAPLLLATANLETVKQQRPALVADAAVKAAQATRAILPADQINQLVVIGPGAGGLLKAAFYLDNRDVEVRVVDLANGFEVSELSDDTKWALFIASDFVPADGFTIRLSGEGYALAEVSK